MEYTILSPKNFKTTRWPGGTTTELFIFPEYSSFENRDFAFRLSTATVEVATSEFTMLPGISRTLLVLDGDIALSHEDHHTVHLKKFDVDQFNGDWKTTCIGTCTDFNLMTRGEVSGGVRAILLENDQIEQFAMDDNDWCFIYVYSGNAVIKIDNNSISLCMGDVLVFENCKRNVLLLNGIERGELVMVQITF